MPSPTAATNVRLPLALLAELRARAVGEGRSLADLFREALSRYLHPEQEPGRDPLAGFVGSFESGLPDLGREHDHYLYGTPKRGARAVYKTPRKSEVVVARSPDRHQRADRPRRPKR